MKKPLPWVPWHVDSWIYGSSRLELTRAQRSDFLDLVLLSAKDSGWIRANETMGYPLAQLAGMLSIKPEDLEDTIERCVQVGKITRHENGILYITSYERYRLSPRYLRKLEHGSGSSDSSSSEDKSKRKGEESKGGRKSGPVFRKSGTGPPPPGKRDLDKDGLLPMPDWISRPALNELKNRRAEIRSITRALKEKPDEARARILKQKVEAFNELAEDFS